MSATEKRIQRLASLDQARMKGIQAEGRLKEFEPVLKAREVAYMRELIATTRTQGEVYDAAVWKLVALNDLVLDLDRAIERGQSAARKMQELSEAGGGE